MEVLKSGVAVQVKPVTVQVIVITKFCVMQGIRGKSVMQTFNDIGYTPTSGMFEVTTVITLFVIVSHAGGLGVKV